MSHAPPTITVTLHWQGGAGPRAANIICEDSQLAQLLPILAAGCGLPERDLHDTPISYVLRLGATGGRLLSAGRSLSAQGVCDGSHLWLGALRAAAGEPRHCALALPHGGAVLVPLSGLTLTRSWLLRALELLHPESHALELHLLDTGRSSYRYVSKQPHCAIAPAEPGAWQVVTERDDVGTLLNGSPLPPHRPAALADGDSLRIGVGGPALMIALI